MTTPGVGSYLRWKKEVAEHDYTAAASYLSIRFGQDHADQVAAGPANICARFRDKHVHDRIRS